MKPKSLLQVPDQAADERRRERIAQRQVEEGRQDEHEQRHAEVRPEQRRIEEAEDPQDGCDLSAVSWRTPASPAYPESCLGNAYAVGCRLVARTYTAGEAARALGISLDTLRRWDRQGRIRVQRDAANRRVVTAREVERMRGEDHRTLSARNRLEGVVREVKIEGLLAEIELDVTKGGRLVAVITRESAESLGLTRGMSASAVVKATSVMVER